MNAYLLLQAGQGSMMSNYIFIGAMFLVVWFFMIRPQAKKQREQDTFIKEIKHGDKIVTSSGIIGKITKLDEKTVTLEVGPKTQLQVTRGAINKEMTASFNEDES